jgi:hypothetical protein
MYKKEGRTIRGKKERDREKAIKVGMERMEGKTRQNRSE